MGSIGFGGVQVVAGCLLTMAARVDSVTCRCCLFRGDLEGGLNTAMNDAALIFVA